MTKRILSFIMSFVIIYFGLCYGEILIKNTHDNPQYSRYNAIIRVIENVSKG